MREGIHPEYRTVKVTCACGEVFYTGTTKRADEMKIDICSKCHPFFTGKQKVIDSGGRIDKFNKRFSLGNK